MPRKPTGQVIAPGKRQRTWGIRFRAYGERQYVTLGRSEDGWDRRRAEQELEDVLARVRCGIWRPTEVGEPEPSKAGKTFHEFATEWLAIRESDLAPKTVAVYRWALVEHLLPIFATHGLEAITAQEVDRYRSAKVREGRLGPAQINKTLKVLAQILDLAADYEMLDPNRANPARGRKRLLKEPKVKQSWVEPEQLLSLIEAANPNLRPLLATLGGCGTRIGETVALDWRDVNLATGTITMGRAKTDAGSYREVDMPIGVVDELREWKARTPRPGDDDPVFVNNAARRQTDRNVENRIKTAIRHANVRLKKLEIEPISEKVTPHSLRRTYASLRTAAGDDPVYIAEQGGWEDPAFVLRVYARAVKRRSRLDGNYLSEFDRALVWAGMGREAETADTLAEDAGDAAEAETA
jgi:integrase